MPTCARSLHTETDTLPKIPGPFVGACCTGFGIHFQLNTTEDGREKGGKGKRTRKRGKRNFPTANKPRELFLGNCRAPPLISQTCIMTSSKQRPTINQTQQVISPSLPLSPARRHFPSNSFRSSDTAVRRQETWGFTSREIIRDGEVGGSGILYI